jgi:hypothetical protein
MIMGFIYVTPMLSKSDESHIACSVAYEAIIYSAFVNDITIEVHVLLLQVLISPFPNKKT